MKNGIASYRKTQVQTASPLEQIILLYEKYLSCIAQAKTSIARRDVGAKGRQIGRAIDIIVALDNALDPSYGEIASNLNEIYHLCLQQLSLANTTNTIEPLNRAEDYMRELLEAWKQIKENEGQGNSGRT